MFARRSHRQAFLIPHDYSSQSPRGRFKSLTFYDSHATIHFMNAARETAAIKSIESQRKMSFLHKTMTNEEISQIRYLKRVRRQFQCLHLQLRISPFSLVGARRASKKLKIFHAAAIKSERFNDQFIKWQRNKFAIINCKVNTTREPFNNGERFLWASVQS